MKSLHIALATIFEVNHSILCGGVVLISFHRHHTIACLARSAAAGREMRAKANEPQTDIERP